jgi:creatinine amidohydrolase
MPCPRADVLSEANYRQLLAQRPRVAVLPWGATEAHGWHLPHGTDVIEASRIAEHAVELASARGGRPLLLPAIPFGNNAQQQDQVATVHISTTTALAILRDVTRSLIRQGVDKLVLLNGHGGNAFAPLVRDVMLETGATIVVVNFWQLCPQVTTVIFPNPGDHAGDLETSLLLHLASDLVDMDEAGEGRTVPFAIPHLSQPGVWTPRPWSHSHPDTGCGDPRQASAEKGEAFFRAASEAVADMLVAFSEAVAGQTPYLGRACGNQREESIGS